MAMKRKQKALLLLSALLLAGFFFWNLFFMQKIDDFELQRASPHNQVSSQTPPPDSLPDLSSPPHPLHTFTPALDQILAQLNPHHEVNAPSVSILISLLSEIPTSLVLERVIRSDVLGLAAADLAINLDIMVVAGCDDMAPQTRIHPALTLIERSPGSNCTRAQALNFGASVSLATILVFLDEAAIPGPNWLLGLLRPHFHAHQGTQEPLIIGSRIVDATGHLVSAGFEFHWHPFRNSSEKFLQARQGSRNALLPSPRGAGAHKADPQFLEEHAVHVVSSLSLSVQRKIFLLLLFSPETGNQTKLQTDIDFCLRAILGGPISLILVSSESMVTVFDDLAATFAPELLSIQDKWATSSLLEARYLQDKKNISVVWDGYLNDCTGWASEAISYVSHLEKSLSFLAIVGDDNFCPGYPQYIQDVLRRMRISNVPPGSVDIWVSHKPPPSYPRFPYKGLLYYQNRPPYVIGRSMVESSLMPGEWIEHFSRVDEVWVPSNFLIDVFVNAGVPRPMLHRIPESVDVNFYSPELTDALPLSPNNCTFKFLSVFKWEERKGWDVLLEAFAREFTATEGACLFIQTYLFQARGIPTSLEEILRDFLKTLLLPDGREPPQIILLTKKLPKKDMPRLYKAADAFVLPTRGEGWGLPMMEAMAMGLPTISTNFSGVLEFMYPDNSYLVRVEDMVPPKDTQLYKPGMLWAQPSVSHLQELLRHVFTHREEAKEIGQRARASVVRNFSEERVSLLVVQRLQEIKDKLQGSWGSVGHQ